MRRWWWWWWIVFAVWLTYEGRLALFPVGTIARYPHHRESPTRSEQNNIANGKYWRRSSLIRNLLNVKHHAPYKSVYSKYQIIKILENCFPKLNCFSWIKLTPVLIHLKYWLQFPTPTASLPRLTIPVIFFLSQLKSFFNTILIMLSFGFPISSYPIRPHAITIIW